ncbi:MAG: HD domain-containing phosphohydrolase [Candidatus Omnitrophota bacterium]
MVKINKSIFSRAIYYLEHHEKSMRVPAWIIRHQKEVFFIAYRMGEVLGFASENLTALAITARFHDIGKSNIDPGIINNQGVLSDAQRYEVFEHVLFSYQILKKKGINSKIILKSVFHHHENYDGSGYPDKLRATEIPVFAQILRIADSFSAMLGARPYRNPKGKNFKSALTQIENGRGTFYNPKMVDVFLRILQTPDKSDLIPGLNY